jgi:ABC-type hemin transport system ATPase subunit
MLAQFIESFKKAISMEMDAMRTRMGPFEVPLGPGDSSEAHEDEGKQAYGFRVLQPNEKLTLGAECSLMTGTGREHLVEISSLDKNQIVLSCSQEIDVDAGPHVLVVYPWFLYEKLQVALQSLVDSDTFHTDSALELFGKLPSRGIVGGASISIDGTQLNDSQRQAILLSCERTPAFVWGPPGTGKTTTLGHIVTALLQNGKRILVTSTTNAAIDQALAKLVELELGRKALARGDVVRLGQAQEETHGASVREVVERLNTQLGGHLLRLEERQFESRQLMARCEELLARLASAAPSTQLGLFGDTPASGLDERNLEGIFSPSRVRRLITQEIHEQTAILSRRRNRLQQCRDLCRQKARSLRAELVKREAGAVDGARVVFATMTNVYISSLMAPQRFDVVIVEEAGMAVLPSLFYCAALARSQVIMVGDPQQLPSIVQSTGPYVQRAMARSIFAVTVPQPHDNELVVMLRYAVPHESAHR